ncbi:NADP-dependent malic enzyme-like [Watersipora subatra]|uniref:NADP-dependent malic enzyme-like n=1 Tax=Watersipora subatra TaxID=2589382 RepID=UPI00355B9E58
MSGQVSLRGLLPCLRCSGLQKVVWIPAASFHGTLHLRGEHKVDQIGYLRQRGIDVLRKPEINKGMAFSLAERQILGIHGLLPPAILSQDSQVKRLKANLNKYDDPLQKHIYLSTLQDRSEKLFYRILKEDIENILPIVYTPTVGLACLSYGLIYRKPKGLYVTVHDLGHVYEILCNWPAETVKAIVVTDGERILGLGDLGANGMGIPVGKLALYTALAGIPPDQCLPIMLDVGTNNKALLEDPLYIGLRHERIRGERYDALIDEFMRAVKKRWGQDTLIQFEDFANQNAYRLLDKYRTQYCTFNDDIQGTAAVAVAGLIASTRVTKKRLSEYTFLFQGAGSASTGIANLLLRALIDSGLPEQQALEKIYLFDIHGLLTQDRPKGSLSESNAKFAKSGVPNMTSLDEVVEFIKPNAIIGAAGVAGVFSERILKAMASYHERPVIFALSNPTSYAECTAEQAYTHTQGRAVFASGSPFSPVEYDGKVYHPSQGNNSYVFPGIALAVTQFDIRHLPESFFLASAKYLAEMVSDHDLAEGRVYPPLSHILQVSIKMATQIGGFAYRENMALVYPEPIDKEQHIRDGIYSTDYENFVPNMYEWPDVAYPDHKGPRKF